MSAVIVAPRAKRGGAGEPVAGTSFDEMIKLKNASGYVVGQLVEGKHYRGGWHNCQILEIKGIDQYLVKWQDGDPSDTLKAKGHLRECRYIDV